MFDLDGTLTKRDTYMPFLIGYLCRHPWRLLRTIHLPFAVVMHLLKWRDNSWLKKVFLKACLGGLSRQALAQWVTTFTQSLVANGLREGAVEQLHRHRREGKILVLASASLDVYVEAVGYELGFDHIVCTMAEWDESNCLTGELHTANCYGQEKVKRLTKLLECNDYKSVNIAYTDHHSDLPLLEWAGVGIAVNPTEKLRLASHEAHLQVVAW